LALLQPGRDHRQDPVGQRHQGFLPTQPLGLPGVLPLELRALGTAGCPGHWDERGAQPRAPFGRLRRATLPATLVVAGADSSPRAEVALYWERAQSRTAL